MTKAVSKGSVGRRQFLGGVAAGAIIAPTVSVTVVAVADSETTDEKRKSRYRESEHIKTYYRVNRYPG